MNKQGLIGIIKEKSPFKLYTGKRANKTSYYLQVEIENKPVNKLSVFADKVNEQIWKVIENSKFIDKRYLFHCEKYMGQYHLVDWQELDYGKET